MYFVYPSANTSLQTHPGANVCVNMELMKSCLNNDVSEDFRGGSHGAGCGLWRGGHQDKLMMSV